MKQIVYLFLLAFLSLFLFSCKKQANQANQRVEVGKEMLQNVENEMSEDASFLIGDWNILTVNGVDVNQDETTPYLSFNITDKKMSGMTGCNRIMGDIVINDNQPFSISFDKLASTKMMCPKDSLEKAILLALGEVKNFAPMPCHSEKKVCVSFVNSNAHQIMTLEREPLSETSNSKPQVD